MQVERRIDELGRIVIPKDFLNYLHVKKNSLFRITLTYDSLILEPIQEKIAYSAMMAKNS